MWDWFVSGIVTVASFQCNLGCNKIARQVARKIIFASSNYNFSKMLGIEPSWSILVSTVLPKLVRLFRMTQKPRKGDLREFLEIQNISWERTAPEHLQSLFQKLVTIYLRSVPHSNLFTWYKFDSYKRFNTSCDAEFPLILIVKGPSSKELGVPFCFSGVLCLSLKFSELFSCIPRMRFAKRLCIFFICDVAELRLYM